MKVEEIVQYADALYHDLTFAAAREWQEEHGGAKAIGSMPIYVPREIIHAAGMLPVGLMGGGSQVEIIQGDAYFQSYICQIPRSTIELALTGRFDFLAGFLFPSICDVIRNLSGMWKILFPTKYARYVDVPQNYDREVGGKFWYHEMSELAKELQELSGQKVTPDRLRASLGLYNENRRAIGRLMTLRSEQPWKVPAHESYLVLRAGNVLPVEEHTKLLNDYAQAVSEADRPVRDNTRIVTMGSFCEQPPLELIKTLEMSGCYIVWDDMLLGQYWFSEDLPLDGDPMMNLSQAFLDKSASTAARYEATGEKGDSLKKIFARTKAEGVIFAAPSFCDPALLEQPMLEDALNKAGIPWTAFKYAENLGQFQVIREQAGTFADSVKLWSDK